jgi:hypothetical protein
MLESLFKLGVAAKNPALAALKTVLEFEWDSIQAEMLGSRPGDLPKIRKSSRYSAIGQRIRRLSKRWGLAETAYLSEKKFSTWDWAKAAQLAGLYKSRYAELSSYSHATGTSFIAPSITAYVLAVVTLCLLEAAHRIVCRSSNNFPEDVQQRTTSLWELFQSYHKGGHYAQLFAQELRGVPAPRPEAPEEKFKSN